MFEIDIRISFFLTLLIRNPRELLSNFRVKLYNYNTRIKIILKFEILLSVRKIFKLITIMQVSSTFFYCKFN